MHREAPFIRQASLVPGRVSDPTRYPFSLPVVQALATVRFAAVTYFVGENGTGKSTLLEGLAVASGFNAEGGTVNFRFTTRRSESELHAALRLVKTEARPRTGFFLRAESFFNLATEIESLDSVPALTPPVIDSYGGRSLHEQSHGESFMALMTNRFGPKGLYILDEPEAALSPGRQMAMLVRMHELVRAGSQFIVATHAPIVLAYPDATIYRLGQDGIDAVSYEETEHVTLTRDFLNDRRRFLTQLFSES